MPVHTHILEKIHALLDFNQISKEQKTRIERFSEMFSLSFLESENMLCGNQVPNRELLRRIADTFEVDALWLLQK